MNEIDTSKAVMVFSDFREENEGKDTWFVFEYEGLYFIFSEIACDETGNVSFSLGIGKAKRQFEKVEWMNDIEWMDEPPESLAVKAEKLFMALLTERINKLPEEKK